MGSHSVPKGALGQDARRQLRAARLGRLRASWGPTLFGIAWINWSLTALSTGVNFHAAVVYYVVVAAGLLAVPLAAIFAAAGAQSSARRRAGPLRRWQYGLLALACLVPVAGAAVATVRTHGQPFWWTANPVTEGLGEIAGFCVAYVGFVGLLMLGRAVFWGKPRRWCWLMTSPWLEFSPGLATRLAEQGRVQGRAI